jgi:hypothetical protein
MKVLFDRFVVIGHSGPFRPADKAATTVRHAPESHAPVSPTAMRCIAR